MNKAAFIDVDGTLTIDHTSSWERVHRFFGRDQPELIEKMEEHTNMFFSGKITYNQWAQLDVDLWKGRKYSELKRALQAPILINNAQKGVSLLKESGFDIVLISGGIDELVSEVAKEVDADFYFANQIGQTNGIIDGNVKIEVGNSKVPVVKKISQEMKYSLANCGSIGDNVNDIQMFDATGFSIALNAEKEEVKEAATTSMNTKDFLEVAHRFIELLD